MYRTRFLCPDKQLCNRQTTQFFSNLNKMNTLWPHFLKKMVIYLAVDDHKNVSKSWMEDSQVNCMYTSETNDSLGWTDHIFPCSDDGRVWRGGVRHVTYWVTHIDQSIAAGDSTNEIDQHGQTNQGLMIPNSLSRGTQGGEGWSWRIVNCIQAKHIQALKLSIIKQSWPKDVMLTNDSNRNCSITSYTQ